MHRCYVLAKIQMVTKLNALMEETSDWLCSSKNSDGNKTIIHIHSVAAQLCSSKNSDGNKTFFNVGLGSHKLCSSKNSDGNKTATHD